MLVRTHDGAVYPAQTKPALKETAEHQYGRQENSNNINLDGAKHNDGCKICYSLSIKYMRYGNDIETLIKQV